MLLLTLAARLLPGPRIIDDAYITFRYARNILAGFGPVYNVGERVLGTTTPLYTALLTLAGIPGGGIQAPFPTLSISLNALCDAITVTLLVALGYHLATPWVGWSAALLWAMLPFSVTFAIGGMETSFFMLLLTLTTILYLTKRWVWAALVAAMSLLTRPEAAILIGAMALDWLWCQLRHPRPRGWWLPIAVFGSPLLLWSAFATSYYGSPIPLSISAKRVAYSIPPNAALIRLLQHYATPFGGHHTFGIPWIGVGLLLYPTLFTIGAYCLLQREARLWPWAFFPWIYFAAYALANPLMFRWYLTPPLLPYIFFILLGLDDLSTRLFTLRAPFARAVLTSLLLGLVLHGWTLHPDHGPTAPAPKMAWFKLEQVYRTAAEQLQPHLRPGDVVAAADIGVVGYDTGAPILDTLGLITPQALRYYPLPQDALSRGIPYAVPASLMLDRQPQYAVFLEAYIRHTLLEDHHFLQTYEVMTVLPTDIYGSRGMYIFRRRTHRPLPASSASLR